VPRVKLLLLTVTIVEAQDVSLIQPLVLLLLELSLLTAHNKQFVLLTGLIVLAVILPRVVITVMVSLVMQLVLILNLHVVFRLQTVPAVLGPLAVHGVILEVETPGAQPDRVLVLLLLWRAVLVLFVLLNLLAVPAMPLLVVLLAAVLPPLA